MWRVQFRGIEIETTGLVPPPMGIDIGRIDVVLGGGV
jgi:hypothetical protein